MVWSHIESVPRNTWVRILVPLGILPPRIQTRKHQLPCEVDFVIVCLRAVRKLGSKGLLPLPFPFFCWKLRPILRGVGCCDTVDSMFQVRISTRRWRFRPFFEVDAVECIWETIKNSRCFDCILAKKKGSGWWLEVWVISERWFQWFCETSIGPAFVHLSYSPKKWDFLWKQKKTMQANCCSCILFGFFRGEHLKNQHRIRWQMTVWHSSGVASPITCLINSLLVQVFAGVTRKI